MSLRPKADTAVIVGRFQVDELHDGHRALIESVTSEPYARVIVFLGVAPFRSKQNPLDYLTRARMIRDAFPTVTVLPIKDRPYDELWSHALDRAIRATVPHGRDVVLFGGRDSFCERYHGRFKTVELDGVPQGSGTEVRERLRAQVRSSADFRAGAIYAVTNDYDRVLATVDVACVRLSALPAEGWRDRDDYERHVCLIRKEGEPFWRLPGGFADAGESYEDGALRELLEETGLHGRDLTYVASRPVQDWRSTPDQSITTAFFTADVSSTDDPAPGDDAAEAAFFPLDDARCEHSPPEVMPSHLNLLKLLP